jgi:hypothetical protein
MSNLEVPVSILIFAFRYALNRNTAAAWVVSQELYKYWDELDKDFQKQIIRDIKTQIKISNPEAGRASKISDDWIKFLAWAEKKTAL